jgi:sporulation protein YlmC with PRC-barrel domain
MEDDMLGTALLAAPELAQTSPPAAAPPAAGQSATTSTGNVMTQMQPGHWRASDLEGLNVYNQNNETIGDISELIVDNSGKIQAVVVGVGGFLGIGERDVAFPFDQIRFVNEPRAATGTTGATGTTAGTTGTTAPSGTVAAPASPNAPATATAPATTTAPAATGAAPAGQTAAGAATRTGPDHAVLTANMTKDQLRAVPEFRYAR